MVKGERQKRYRDKMRFEMRCVMCGLKLAAGSKNFCLRHMHMVRLGERRRRGFNAWRPGGPGRKPGDG